MATVHAAARDGDLVELARQLRGDAAALWHPDEFGRTPLHWAALRGHRVVVEWLLANGANPTLRDRDGHTPSALAIHGERLDDRLTADRRAAAASSWPYPQVWRWAAGRGLRFALFSLFLLIAVFGLVLVRPGTLGRSWNTVEVLAEPRLISGDYAHKPLKAMAGSGDTLAVLTEDGDVYLRDTRTRLSRTLCRGVIDLASDDQRTIWLLRADGGIDRAFPLAVGGFTVSAWQPPAERYWKNQAFQSADVLATDLDADGWVVAVPGGVARYHMNPDGSNRRRSWQTGDLSDYPTHKAVAVDAGVWLTGTAGGVRFAERARLNSVSRRELATPPITTLNAGHEEGWASAVAGNGQMWLYPTADTGWVGPLFAPFGSPGIPSAEAVKSAVLQSGGLFAGTADGLFRYDPRQRRFHALCTQPVTALVPVADRGVCWVGDGLRYAPVSARGVSDVVSLEEDSVRTADVSPAGGLCTYVADGPGGLLAIRAVAPTGGTPVLLASNVGWKRPDVPFSIRAIMPLAGAHLVLTDIGAFKYAADARWYEDRSGSADGLLGFRSAFHHRAANEVLAVTGTGAVYRATDTVNIEQPWAKVDLGTFGAERVVACGTTIAATGVEQAGKDIPARGLLAKVGDAVPVLVATRRHEATTSPLNRSPAADLHTPAEGGYRLTLAGVVEEGKLPVYSYTSANSETTRTAVPWADQNPPKQLRWHPAAGLQLLGADGAVRNAAGAVVFGGGSSSLKPSAATALATVPPSGMVIGGEGGRVAEYDWKRGSWYDRPAVPGGETVGEVGAAHGLAFARTTAGVFSHAVGGRWQRHPDAVRWLTWQDDGISRGWLVGPNGVRPILAKLNPDARPDRANAAGIPAFLAKSRHVWRPYPAAGDWLAFTGTNTIGRYSATFDTWLEQDIDGFKRLAAVVPNSTDGAVLLTDTGLTHLSPEVRTTALTSDFNERDTVAVTATGDILAAGAEPRTGYLRARHWRKGEPKEPQFVTVAQAERVAMPVAPKGLSPVAAVASDSGILLLTDRGGVVEYNPDRGVWTTIREPEAGEELVGWYDGTPFHVVMKHGDMYRMCQFAPDATVTELFVTPRPPAQWPEMVRAALPPVAPPNGWIHRRLTAMDPDHGRPGAFALASGLLRVARQWHAGALAGPPTLRTGTGPFAWTRGTGIEVSRDKAGAVSFRLSDGKATRPLTPLPDGGFAEDRFARLGVTVGGELWGFQDEPRRLVRLFVRNNGLARNLTVPPIELPEQLDPITAPDGSLEFRDRFRPGVFWAVVGNELKAHPHRHTPPLPSIPVGDAALLFERTGADGVSAQLRVGGEKVSPWHTSPNGERPAWSVSTDAALAGKSALFATPLGIVVRDRATLAIGRIVPSDNPVSFVRDGAGEVIRIDIGPDSFAWVDGPQPLKRVDRDAVTRTFGTGPWQWRIRHLSADARQVEAIADAGGRKRTELEIAGGKWAFADDRVNWLGKAADGAELVLATDDGVWPMLFDQIGADFTGRGTGLLPGERVAKVRCPVGPIWAKSANGTNWSPVQRGTFAPLPAEIPVPVTEAVIPNHLAWAGTLTDGVLSLSARDNVDRPAFVAGQPYFDRLDGLAALGNRLFTLSSGRAFVERDPTAPATLVAVHLLPAELPAGWLHQVEQVGDGLVLSARNPASDEWRAWRFETAAPGTGTWTAVPPGEVPTARTVAETGVFRWQSDGIGGPLVPVLNPGNAGGGAWKGTLPVKWWWHDTRFAWDAASAVAALSDTAALLITAAGPVRVDIADGKAAVSRVWPGGGFTTAVAVRLADGRKTGVRVSGATVEADFDAGTQLPTSPPAGAHPRECVVTLGPTAESIGFAARWDMTPERRFMAALESVGIPADELFKDGQFTFDRAATACPLPGHMDRWASVTPEGLVCVFDVPSGGGPVVLKSVTKPARPVDGVTAMRAESADAVYLLSTSDFDPAAGFDRVPAWVPLRAGVPPPAGNPGRHLFRAGSRVSVDPARLLWTRTGRYLTTPQPSVPRHDSGREVFHSDANGVAVAADLGIGIAVVRRPTGTEVSVLTRGGLLRTSRTDLDGDAAASFPNVTSAAVPGGTTRVRYRPTGEVWALGDGGQSLQWGRDDWRFGVDGWESEPWTVAGRRVTFPATGGVRVDGVATTTSNNSWRMAWQRPFGAVLDAYPRGDAIWAATRTNGVFKVHPDRLMPK